MNSLLLTLRRRLSFIAFTVAVSAGVGLSGLAVGQETESETPETADVGAEGETAETPPPITREEAQAAAEEGEQAIAAKDYEKAFAAYTKLLQYGSQDPYQRAVAVLMGYTGRGQALGGMQEYDAAIEEFKLATDQSPNFTPALIARGQMFLEAGAAGEALPDFQAAAKQDRANVQAQFGLGKSYVMLGYAQQGITPLTRVITADPQNAEAYRLRGTAHAGVLKVQEALADLQEAIALNPQDYEAYYTLALVYLREEQFDKAAEELGRAIQNYTPKPGQEGIPYMNGYLTLASTYIEHGKKINDPAAKKAAFQAAIDQSETLLKQLDERNSAYAPYRAAAIHSRGVGERMQGDFGKAIKTFTEAIELNPNLAEAYFRRGICFHLIGEDKMAIADFVQSANLNVEQPDPRESMGRFHPCEIRRLPRSRSCVRQRHRGQQPIHAGIREPRPGLHAARRIRQGDRRFQRGDPAGTDASRALLQARRGLRQAGRSREGVRLVCQRHRPEQQARGCVSADGQHAAATRPQRAGNRISPKGK